MASSPAPYVSANTRRACSNCRKRKIKCDGGRPTCGQCIRRAHLGIEECEYADVSGRTQSEILEENIVRLESRINELEDPSRATSVMLHQPYAATQAQPSASLSNLSEISQQEPSGDIRRSILTSFLPHGDKFGFFLNPNRLWESTLSSLPLGHSSRPTPALLSAVYLVSHYMTARDPQQQLQHQLLGRALQEAANTLTSNHPNRIVHGIQAEVLLSTYLFDNGRILEGKYHLSAAVSLAVGAGLHQVRSSRTSSRSLPPSVDSIDEGERINAFWTVYTLSNIWGVAVGSPSSIIFDTSSSSTIDTPWPLEVSDYERRGLPGNIVGSSTISNFLAQIPNDGPGYGSHYASSPLAICVKASALLQTASCIATLFRADMSEAERQDFLDSFRSHDGLVDSFIASSIPPLDGLDPSSSVFGTALLAHTLAYTAAIQLHSVYAENESRSMSKSFAAAEACVSLLRQARNAPLVNPIFAVLWMNAGKVMVQELGRLQNQGRSGSSSRADREARAQHGLQQLCDTMAVFAGRSSLMRDQLSNLQQARARFQ